MALPQNLPKQNKYDAVRPCPFYRSALCALASMSDCRTALISEHGEAVKSSYLVIWYFLEAA